MLQRIVRAAGNELFFAHVDAAYDVFGIGAAQREVASRVLVVQRVEEQDARLGDRRIVGDERHFAQVSGTFVEADELCERVLAFLRAEFHCFALFEADPEAVDNFSVVVQRLGSVDNSVDSLLQRHAEAFLGRHIRVKIHPLRRNTPSSDPDVILDEFDFKICSGFTGEMQFRETVIIQFFGVFDEVSVVLIPVRDGVVVFRDPRHREDRIAELLEGFVFGQVGEHYFGPAHGGHADHAPLPLVVHRVVEQVTHLGVISDLGGLHLLAVDVGHDAGLVRKNRNIAGAFVVLIFRLVISPLRNFGQRFFRLVLISHLGQVVVFPLDGD